MDLESAFENWPRAVFIIDRAGAFFYQNRAMSELNRDGRDSLPDLLDNPPEILYLYLSGKDPESPGPMRLEVKLKQGSAYDLTLAALPDSERTLGELQPGGASGGVSADKVEETIQAIRKLGHDMCQPLTVIMGQTEIMQLTHAQDEEIARRMEAIITESEKLEAMTRKLSLLIQGCRQE